MEGKPNILETWGITVSDLTVMVEENPSMRGLMLGYVAEYNLRHRLAADPRISNMRKDDDHDRKNKGDLRFDYRGYTFRLESKSLQTNSIKRLPEGGLTARFQCDASDRRPVHFPNGSKAETTCLLVGQFDLLAVNLFAFEGVWRFAFALNEDLPRTHHSKYTRYQQKRLLASLMTITWPLQAPFAEEPFVLLDRLIARKARLPN